MKVGRAALPDRRNQAGIGRQTVRVGEPLDLADDCVQGRGADDADPGDGLEPVDDVVVFGEETEFCIDVGELFIEEFDEALGEAHALKNVDSEAGGLPD